MRERGSSQRSSSPFQRRASAGLAPPVESAAASAAEIVIETLAVEVSERGATRMDDKTSEASMEKRKKEGYF